MLKNSDGHYKIASLNDTATAITIIKEAEYHVITSYSIHYTKLYEVGRLQVPKEYLEAVGIQGRASMEFDGDKIVITAPKSLEEENA